MNAQQPDVTAIILAGGKGTRMDSDLPKVLHELRGRSLIRYAVDNVRKVGIGDVIVVVGHRRDLVMEHLDGLVRFAVQEEQLGTGHAVLAALSLLEDSDGPVFVCYGDMPFLDPATIRETIEVVSRQDAAAAILTMTSDDSPPYGRVVRDGRGRVLRVVEVGDCTPEELRIKEVNVGVYCFDAGALRWALPRLGDANAQGEYQLTDVVRVLVEGGWRVETVRTENSTEALGVNDRSDLARAEVGLAGGEAHPR
jgi:bifunctional UDP-N-acetylglucosamine pyrophosphorylase / glucosamine-1-phosphate N-acetyltransferase